VILRYYPSYYKCRRCKEGFPSVRRFEYLGIEYRQLFVVECVCGYAYTTDSLDKGCPKCGSREKAEAYPGLEGR